MPKHPYNPQCDCPRCIRERARRAAQAATDSRQERAAQRKFLKAERRAEQRIADHIDGYDRDDLGLSADY